jgi:hypothetical protein
MIELVVVLDIVRQCRRQPSNPNCGPAKMPNGMVITSSLSSNSWCNMLKEPVAHRG